MAKAILNKQILLVVLGVVIGVIATCIYLNYQDTWQQVSSFDECVAQGNPVQESYPARCISNGKSFTQDVSRQVTLSGQIVCLPHVSKSGPQTLECAFGLKDEQGIYYALETKNYSSIPDTNTNVVVTGKLRPNDTDNVYDTAGKIQVDSISKK